MLSLFMPQIYGHLQGSLKNFPEMSHKVSPLTTTCRSGASLRSCGRVSGWAAKAMTGNNRQISDIILRMENSGRINVKGAQCCRVALNSASSHRSEEHTSELQSPKEIVCRLL